MSLPPPLSLGYWFNVSPPEFVPIVGKIFLAFCAVCVALGIAAQVIRMRRGMEKMIRRALGRAGVMFITMGCVGFLLYAFLYQRIPYLSMRLWLGFWLVGFAIWAFFIARFAFVTIPSIKRQRAEREQFEKWLPKKRE